jgi:hypothetical protein
MLEKKLSETREHGSSKKDCDVPHRSRMMSRIEDVSG